MGKKKITLDTNVLISAFGWGGKPKEILYKIIDGEIELFISESQFTELAKTLDYPKFKFSEEQKERFKALIFKIAIFVEPLERVEIIKTDPDDNIFLECALAGKLDYIVTGDSDLLKLNEFKGTKIVTPEDFLFTMNFVHVHEHSSL